MSLNYFEEKEVVKKRLPRKRTEEQITKKETFRQAFEEFIDVKKKQGLRAASLNQFVVVFKNVENFHAESHDKPLILSNITTAFLSDWIYWQKHECVRYGENRFIPASAKTAGLSDSTIATRIKRLKTFINYCVKHDKFQRNPFDKVETFKQDATTIEILTRNEMDNLLKVCKNQSEKSYKNFRDLVLLHVLIDSMCRINEALTLSPNDIDHTNRSVIIRSSNAKSRRSRVIPLSNKTYRLIVQLIAENEAFDGEVDDLIFLSLSGRKLDNNNVLRDFRKLAVEAGIEQRFFLHQIRHSSATLYLSSGGDLETLRLILGHADNRTTLIYLHLADVTVSKAHNDFGFFGNTNATGRKRDNKRK